MSSASGSSRFGANFSASFQTKLFKTGGGKKRDLGTTTTLRKQASCANDNTYGVLQGNRIATTGVDKKEKEMAMLTTRQPHSLAPRGSSDSGSSGGSGQSPSSTNPGSPSAISAPPPGLTGYKRPGYYQGADGIETKKQRISHYRKPETSENIASATTNNPIERRGDGCPPFSVLDNSSSCRRSTERQSQRNDKEHAAGLPNQTLFGPITRPKHQSSDQDVETFWFQSELEICLRMYPQPSTKVEIRLPNFDISTSNNPDYPSDHQTLFGPMTRPKEQRRSADEGDEVFRWDLKECLKMYPHYGPPMVPTIATSTSKNSDHPDYKTFFTKITSEQQKKRYQDEYRSSYEEYRRIYSRLVVESNRGFTLQPAPFQKEQRTELPVENQRKSDEMQPELKRSTGDLMLGETRKRLMQSLGKLTHLNQLLKEYSAR